MPLNILPEKVLLEGVKRGEAASFSALFVACYADLVCFAAKITGQKEIAEEMVQESFMKFWEERDSIQVRASFKSYMLKTVQNRCIDWLRHKKISRRYEAMTRENSLDYIYDTDNYILKSELQSLIDKTLDTLPPQLYAVFTMSRHEGLKYHEIAEKLDVSVRTVEVRMVKALGIMRENLKEYLPG